MILNTIKILIVLAIYYGFVYIFNHYNAWVGIIGALLFTAALVTYIKRSK